MKTAALLKIVRLLVAARRKVAASGGNWRLIRALDIAAYEAGRDLGNSLKD